MALLLHAISTPEHTPVPQSGLRGGRLVRIQDQELPGWATEFGEPLQLTQSDLLDHHAIISRIHTHVEGCLPARLPTWFSDEAALCDAVRGHRAQFVDALERVRDRCEFAVTALWTSPAADMQPSAARSGKQYLLERKRLLQRSAERRERAQALAGELERLIGADLIVEVRRKLCPSPQVALSLALLVRRESADEVARRSPRGAQDVRILVNGPWPPYTFAGVGIGGVQEA